MLQFKHFALAYGQGIRNYVIVVTCLDLLENRPNGFSKVE